jgi:hypothetical protein
MSTIHCQTLSRPMMIPLRRSDSKFDFELSDILKDAEQFVARLAYKVLMPSTAARLANFHVLTPLIYDGSVERYL